MRKTFSLFTALTLCIGLGAQTTFISEVKISAEAGGTTNKQRLIDDGFTVIDQDLNAHEGGRDIYIGYKTTTNAAEAITGLLIMESSSGVDVRLAQYKTTPITYRGKNYYRCDSYGSDYVDCDLNRKSGGADITLYYTKDGNTDDGGTPFTVLTAVGENKSMTGYLYTRHWIYGTDMYSTAENDVYGNTNEDNGSYKIYLPYQVHTHAYTATFNWADDGHSCSVTTLCACGDGSTGDATITSEVKTLATYRVDGITTYTAKITLNNKEFTGTKDVQDIVMPLAEVKTIVKGMIDNQVAAETRADVSALGNEKKALVDVAATRDDVLAILDAFPADRDAAVAVALAEAREEAKAAVQATLLGVTDADILGYGNKAMANIDSATSIAQINNYKEATLAEIQNLKELLQAKADAKAAIQAALQGVEDADILAAGSTALTDIDNASTIDRVNTIKSDALAEIQRLKNLVAIKADAIADIESLICDTEDALAISEGNKYIALIRTARTADAVNSLLAKATGIINNLLTESDALDFTFIGSNMPIETQHNLEGLKMTYSDDGEEMTVTVNGASVTYDLDNVSELAYFRGTPTVSLRANEDPDKAGNYFTTFYSGLEAYTLPEGVKAYTAEISENTVLLSPIEGEILPQGEAVLLYSNELHDGNWTMEIADPSSVSKSTTNQFEGVDVATAQQAANYYMLSYGQEKLGFYRMNSSTMLAANKAFIVQSHSAPARALRMVFADDVDGIESISSDSANSPTGIFSVSGMRLDKFQKGINIVNGKKVIIK